MGEPSIQQFGAGLRHGLPGSGSARGRVVSFILTAVAHLGLLAAFLFGVRVVAPVIDAKPLTVSIEKLTPPPPPVLAIVPKMVPAPAIQVPVPEFTIQSPPSPVLATYAAPGTGAVGKVASGGAGAGCALCYLESVRKYLQGFMVYPREAQDRHVQGTVVVHFISDRAGNLISFEVLNSSGHAVLDEAALALMRQAGKIPPIPADLHVPMLDTRIPITYMLPPSSDDLASPLDNGRFGHFGR